MMNDPAQMCVATSERHTSTRMRTQVHGCARTSLPQQDTHSQDFLRGGLHDSLPVKTLQDDGVGTLGVEADGALGVSHCEEGRVRLSCPRAHCCKAQGHGKG